METFNFEIHRKVTTWQKDLYAIEATNMEVAKQKAIAIFKDDYLQFYELTGYRETETLFTKMKDMSIIENNNEATQQLVYKNETILDNKQKQTV